MRPGFLHFNLRSGCTADMLIEAMADLLKDSSCADPAVKPRGDTGELRELFLNSKLPPRLAGTALKILENFPSAPKEKLVTLCAYVEALDPKFISASKIFIGEQVNDGLWSNELLIGLPCVEVEHPIPVDALGVAFVKALVGRFGPRGDSVVIQIGRGGPLEALWCEPERVSSIAEDSVANNVIVDHLFEVFGHIPLTTDMARLTGDLRRKGASSISHCHVFDDKNLSKNAMRFLVDSNNREAIELFLLAGALDVRKQAVESHALIKRFVTVPLGFGQKQTTCQIYEYLYYDQVVRAEPMEDEVLAYAKKHNFSVDVARRDLVLAWKKWRNGAVNLSSEPKNTVGREALVHPVGEESDGGAVRSEIRVDPQ